jgi:phosphotriesterase-related protein
MMLVETVRGPVASHDLGRTLMHEHVFTLDPAMHRAYGTAWGPNYWDEDREIERAVANLQRLRAAGFDTFVDPSVPGVGRWVPLIQRVNEQVDMNIVVATGYFSLASLPLFLRMRSPAQIAELYVREIREGVDGTDVKAAFLKFVVEGSELVGDVPLLLKAIAMTHHETGVPIMVHTDSITRSGRPALQALQGEGVDPRRIVIAHAGDSDDLDYLRELADTGASLGYDRFPGEHRISLERRIANLVALIEDGYADRIHLSNDAASFLDFPAGDQDVIDLHLEGDYLFAWETAVPMMVGAGVSAHELDQILIRNPARFFDPDFQGGNR